MGVGGGGMEGGGSGGERRDGRRREWRGVKEGGGILNLVEGSIPI